MALRRTVGNSAYGQKNSPIGSDRSNTKKIASDPIDRTVGITFREQDVQPEVLGIVPEQLRDGVEYLERTLAKGVFSTRSIETRTSVAFDNVSENPEPEANKGHLLTRHTGGKAELFFLSDDGTLTQVTPGGGGGGGGGTLDTAYDFGGPGLGRIITTDSGPVQLTDAGPHTKVLAGDEGGADLLALFSDGDAVFGGTAMLGTETLRVIGDALLEGDLTVTGNINEDQSGLWNYDGLDAGPVTILPAGSVDDIFAYRIIGNEVVGAGVLDFSGNLTPGNTEDVYDDGVDVVTVEVTAGGAVQISVSAGLETFDITLEYLHR